MPLQMQRIILFVNDMKAMSAFYRDVLGLKPLFDSKYPSDEWLEFDAGAAKIALHKAFDPAGKPATWNKITFHASDVPTLREELIARGARMQEVNDWGELIACDGLDPEGNRFQISNR